MSGILLDTNVVSEVVKADPEPRVVSFLAEEPDLWLSVVVVHEAHYGLFLMPDGHRRESLRSAVSALIAEYDNRILPVTRWAAECAARLRVDARRAGRVLNLADALIAGTAIAHDLAIATRNVGDFDGLGIEILDPWTSL